MDAYNREIVTLKNASSERVYGQWSLNQPDPDDAIPSEIFFSPQQSGEWQNTVLQTIYDSLIQEEAACILDLDTQKGPDELGLISEEQESESCSVVHHLLETGRADSLPFPDNMYQVVRLHQGIGKIDRPLELFREVARVLKSGGIFLVTYGPAHYVEADTRMWAMGDDFDHLLLVESFFSFSESFKSVATRAFYPERDGIAWDSQGLAPKGKERDTVYAVWGYKEGLPDSHRKKPPFPEPTPPEPKSAHDIRFDDQGRAHCPHCESAMERIAPPVTPFEIDYGVPVLEVCFNKECPYHKRSRWWMRRQGQVGTVYRFSHNPDNGATGPILDNLFSGLASSKID